LEADARYNPWLAWRMPEIYFTRHKQDGQFIRKKEDIATDRLSNKLQTTMNGWREDGCSSIHGAMD
jgi:hypothetical protein